MQLIPNRPIKLSGETASRFFFRAIGAADAVMRRLAATIRPLPQKMRRYSMKTVYSDAGQLFTKRNNIEKNFHSLVADCQWPRSPFMRCVRSAAWRMGWESGSCGFVVTASPCCFGYRHGRRVRRSGPPCKISRAAEPYRGESQMHGTARGVESSLMLLRRPARLLPPCRAAFPQRLGVA